jgi:hypothetical protein
MSERVCMTTAGGGYEPWQFRNVWIQCDTLPPYKPPVGWARALDTLQGPFEGKSIVLKRDPNGQGAHSRGFAYWQVGDWGAMPYKGGAFYVSTDELNGVQPTPKEPRPMYVGGTDH